MTGRALRRGKRPLTGRERNSLRNLHAAMLEAIEEHGVRSDKHRAARIRLAGRMRALATDGVPASHLALAIGVHRSRANVLARYQPGDSDE